MIDVFLSVPVQGHRLPRHVYDAIIRGVDEAGLHVVNSEVNQPPTIAELSGMSAGVIHSHNRAQLEAADFVIAEVSRPSLGVGYELATAEALGLPILAMCDVALLPEMSLMIRGMTYERFELVPYKNYQEIAGIIRIFILAQSRSVTTARGTAGTEAVVEHFDGVAEVYDESTEWRQDGQLLQWLASRLVGCARCLDVGTGTGLVGASIRNGGATVVGLDRSGRMLRRAESRLNYVIQGEATELPFGDAVFDGACIRSVLHYIDDVRALREVRRVVRKKGTVVCAQATTPGIAAAAWWELLKKYTQPLRRRYYTDMLLGQRFKAAGFSLVATEGSWIVRHETWEGVLRHCPPAHHDAVRSMIRAMPPAVRDATHMRVHSEGVTYAQHWTLLAAVPAANEE